MGKMTMAMMGITHRQGWAWWKRTDSGAYWGPGKELCESSPIVVEFPDPSHDKNRVTLTCEWIEEREIAQTKEPSRAWKDKVNGWMQDAVQRREEALDEWEEALEDLHKAGNKMPDELKKRKGPAGKQDEQLRKKVLVALKMAEEKT